MLGLPFDIGGLNVLSNALDNAVIEPERSSSRTPRRRIAYLSGPLDALQVYRDFASETPSEYYGTLYFAQLLDVLRSIDADCLIITTLPGKRWRETVGPVTVVNIPMNPTSRGIFHHLSMVAWAARSIFEIVKFGPQAAILTAGQGYFWLFRILGLFSINLIASLHCTLWPKLMPRRRANRVLTWLNGRLFFPACSHIQAVSQDIVDQIVASSSRLAAPPVKFVPTYNPASFASIEAARHPLKSEPFHLLYVGRLETNKGVFDLVEMMTALDRQEPGRYILTICGEGSIVAELTSAVEASGVANVIKLAGGCTARQLADHYAQSHAVIVPTRRDFEEGYAKVAAEAILNLRPLITSAACPALADVAPATLEATVDQPDTYVDAIRRLANDEDLFDSKVAAAGHVRKIYFDMDCSYQAAIGAPLRQALGLDQERLRPKGSAISFDRRRSADV